MIGDNAVKQAVDESSGIAGTKSLGQFDRFVNNHFGWRRLQQDLISSQPQDASIDGRHAIERPVLGDLLDGMIDRIEIRAYALNEFECELA